MVTEKKNILWIDYAKVIGIFLVIFGHTIENMRLINIYELMSTTWNYIYLFHMPLFFIISGYLCKQNKNFGKLFYSLLVPYILYQFLFFPLAIEHNLSTFHANNIQTVLKSLVGIIFGDFYITKYSMPVCGPCWFFFPIIYLRILFSHIKLSNKNLLIMVVVSFILLKILLTTTTDLIFCIDNTLMALPYFIFGYYLKSNNFFNNFMSENTKKYNFYSVLYVLLALPILYILLKINGLIEMNLEIIPSYADKSLFLSYIGGIVGSIAIIIISKFILVKNEFVDIVSKNTLFIIFFHFFIIYILKWMNIEHLVQVINNPYYNVILGFVLSVVILLMNYLIIKILINKCPILLGKQQKIK